MATKKEVKEEIVETKTGTVHECSLLNVRFKPDMDAEVLGMVKVGETCDVLEELKKKGWVKVRFHDSGLEGYCVADYIKI